MDNHRGTCANFSADTILNDSFCSLSRLETLHLELATLSGSFPSEFGRLASLKHLLLTATQYNVPVSKFGGKIPSSFQHLGQLKTLRLEQTSLTGFVDPIFGMLPDLEVFSLSMSPYFDSSTLRVIDRSTKLKILDLSVTQLATQIGLPEDMPNLTYLNLAFSLVHWTIPTNFFATHPELTYFSADQALAVRGAIGEEIGTMTKLTYLNIAGTAITGTIPRSIVHCPLETLTISRTVMRHPIPSNIGLLNATLTHLEITGMISPFSTMPDSIGDLKRLMLLDLSSNGLQGTIPAQLSRLSNLRELSLHNNAFVGSIPEVQARRIDLHNNQLSGSVPFSISAAIVADLSNNQIEGGLSPQFFMNTSRIVQLNLAHNHLSGPLPSLSDLKAPKVLDFSYNDFNGALADLNNQLTKLDLSHNRLSGPLPPRFFSKCDLLRSLNLGFNNLSGTLPDPSSCTLLNTMILPSNALTGTFPDLPSSLRTLDLSGNRFSGGNLETWARSAGVQGLNYLDLSGNQMEAWSFSYLNLIGPKLNYLSIASNSLNSPNYKYQVFPLLNGLDLSHTFQFGLFPSEVFPNLALLKLAGNFYHGVFPFFAIKSITMLDISFNQFKFDVATLASLPVLTAFEARSNQIFGSLVLQDLPNLQSVDLSQNQLDVIPDFSSIGDRFKGYLQTLNISSNPSLPQISNLWTSRTGLARGTSSAPSHLQHDTVTCYTLEFYNNTGRAFIYDESLFSYLQCDCKQGHFGTPPYACHQCPSEGTSTCEARLIDISPHRYTRTEAYKTSAPTAAEPEFFSPAVMNPFSGDAPSHPNEASASEPNFRLETESCLFTTVQTLSLKSNCLGLRIAAEELSRPNASIEKILETQCATGSDGRLCSRCQCDSGGVNGCWFLSGPTCSKCRRVFPLSTSVPLVISSILVLIAVLSVVLALVLRRKRRQSLKRFDKLPLMKRVFYRLVHLTSLGNVSILVTFLQMLLAFTQWDAYARVNIFSVLNGAQEGLGLRCLFPFLADPLFALILQLSVPFVAVIVLAISVYLGGWIAGILERREIGNRDRFQHLTLSHSTASLRMDDEYQDSDALISDDDEVVVEYPTLALLTSLSITVVKFFYFGTALAAHEYLFSYKSDSGHMYVQSKPWMLHSESWALIMASLPAILIFDIGTPITFVIICWKFRHTFKASSMQVYFGSLFETYNPRCFWWEIVNTLRKLSIALVMKAFTSNLQSASVVTILSGTQLLQVSLSPWKRKTENIADGASSLLLIAALIYTRPANYDPDSPILWYTFALSVVFVLLSVAIILWTAITEPTDYEARIIALGGWKLEKGFMMAADAETEETTASEGEE